MSYQLVRTGVPDEVFRSLADPTRRGILEHLLEGGEQNVRALTERAGVSQATVSKHLGVLKQAGLVRDRPQGRMVHYAADPQGLSPLVDWIGFYSAFWRDRLDQLDAVLDRIEP